MYIVTIFNENSSAVINEIDANSKHRIYNATIEQIINSIHTFSFTINILHQNYSDVKEKYTRVKITNSGKIVFDGYVLKIEEFMDSTGKFYKTVVCESAIGYLHDSIQAYWTTQSPSFTFVQFVEHFLAIHNSQVEDYKQIRVGKIENNKPTYNSFTIQYGKSFDVLKYITDRFGGEFQVRTDDNGQLYFDYSTDGILPSENKIPIKLAHNLQSLDSFVDGSQVITMLYPYGAKKLDDEGNETQIRHDISSVNGGKFYVTAEDGGAALARYGKISGVEFFDDVTDLETLKSLGQQSINNKSLVTASYKISALDLAAIGLEVEQFSLGGLCQLINPIMGIDREIRVIKQTIDINAPQKSAIEVGQITQSISALALSAAELANIVDGLTARLPEIQQQTLTQASQNTHSAIEELGEIITGEKLTQLLNFYVTLSYLQSNYSTTAAINSQLENLATTVFVTEILNDYVKKDENIDAEKITIDSENLVEKIAGIIDRISEIEGKLEE